MVTLVQTGTHARESDAAFSRLFAAEFPYVWASLRRFGVSARDAEDVAHDVFLQVYGKWSTYDPARPIRPWLFAFAFRAASDYVRLTRHRVEVMGIEGDSPAEAPLAEEALASAEESRLVSQALESIPLERRAVLVAYELDDVPMKDVAASLEIPLHTAYSRLRVAREDFASAIHRLRVRRGES